MRLEIMKMGINGEGIAYLDRIPVFIPGALIHEMVEVKIVEKRDRYMKGEILRLIKASPFRIESPCFVQEKCGGCPLMIFDVSQQLKWKRDHLKQTLIKYAQIDPRLIDEIQKNPDSFSYRNQCKLPIIRHKGKLVCGLYQEGSNHVVPVKNCLIHDELLEKCRKEIMRLCNRYNLPDFASGKGLRALILRVMDNHIQVAFVTGKINLPDEFTEAVMHIESVVSVVQSINPNKKSRELFGKETVVLKGCEKLEFTAEGLHLQLSPNSFFQLNTKQAFNLFNRVKEFLHPGKLMVEAYCGVGVMSLLYHELFHEVIGIEIVKEAIVNAKQNALNNHIENCQFLCGDSARECRKIASVREIDCLIVDPPRSGLDEEMIKMIKSSRINQIVYISCNPSTLAKNLAEIKGQYQIKRILPFDMFTHTPHVETVCLLERK